MKFLYSTESPKQWRWGHSSHVVKVMWLIQPLLFSQLEGVASRLSPEHRCPFPQWTASWHPVWQWEGNWLHSELHKSVSVCGTSGVCRISWGRVRIWSPFRFHWISKLDYFLQALDQQPIKVGKKGFNGFVILFFSHQYLNFSHWEVTEPLHSC